MSQFGLLWLISCPICRFRAKLGPYAPDLNREYCVSFPIIIKRYRFSNGHWMVFALALALHHARTPRFSTASSTCSAVGLSACRAELNRENDRGGLLGSWVSDVKTQAAFLSAEGEWRGVAFIAILRFEMLSNPTCKPQDWLAGGVPLGIAEANDAPTAGRGSSPLSLFRFGCVPNRVSSRRLAAHAGPERSHVACGAKNASSRHFRRKPLPARR